MHKLAGRLFFPLSLFFSLSRQDKTTLSILEKLHGLLGIDRNDAEPHSVEARRRLAFFTNSLFMDMPRAPPVQVRVFFFFLDFAHPCLVLAFGVESLPVVRACSRWCEHCFVHVLLVCARGRCCRVAMCQRSTRDKTSVDFSSFWNTCLEEASSSFKNQLAAFATTFSSWFRGRVGVRVCVPPPLPDLVHIETYIAA